MAYRRKGKKIDLLKEEWADWLKENADLITASGLPDIVVLDEEHWGDFLDHGILDHHYDPLGFQLDHLSIKQKVALLRLVNKRQMHLNTVVGSKLISALLDACDNWYKD